MAMKKFMLYGHAMYGVRPGWGYTVEIFNGDQLVAEYSAGDCQFDSQVYGTGQIDAMELEQFARQTSEEMMIEKFGYCGPLERNDSIIPEGEE